MTSPTMRRRQLNNGLSTFLGLLLCSSSSLGFGLSPNVQMDRREALTSAASLLTTLVASPSLANADSVVDDESSNSADKKKVFTAYSIIPDASASLSPDLVALEAIFSTASSISAAVIHDPCVQNSSFLKRLAVGDNAKGGALWLGEHHNSVKDHILQADFIEAVYKERQGLATPAPMAIGLEQVQLQFQPALDDYISGKTSLEEMRKQVDWEKRWFWSFEGYAPIFERARELKIPLIALNVDSEDLAEVERAGFAGLPPSRLKQYIKDPQGFASFATQREYKTYVDYVIAPSYDLHDQMGLLKTTIMGLELDEPMTFRNFFSGRILWDESMASNAHSWVEKNPTGLIVGLVGADHVKFRDGIPGRFARMGGDSLSCTSVLLNPTLIDTRPPGSVSSVAGAASSQYPDQITLQLRYLKADVDKQDPEARKRPESTGGVLPLADYIVVS